jgi:WS/DGAT/MGAT family acyltransferase
LLGQDLRLLKAAPRAAMALAMVSRRAARTFRLLPEAVRLAPKTIFNVSITRERSYGTASISLTDVKHVAKARHASVNDVVMTICAGALYRYLAARKALPKKPLIAAVPISLREPGHTEMNNQVGVMLCGLATDVADPLERLAAIAASSQDSRGRFVDTKDIWPTDISLLGAPLLVTGLARLVERTRIFDILPNVFNLWLSNVPGPRQPMYCAGARAVHYFPVSVPYHGAALNITVQSYLDNVEFGLTACRMTVPDVQVIANHMIEEFAVLAQAADAVSNAGAVEVIEITAPALSARAAPQEVPMRAAGESATPREAITVGAVPARAEKRAVRTPVKPAGRSHPAPAPAAKGEHH